MTQTENQEIDSQPPLLKDEEFMMLIEHEFQNQGQPQNDIARKKVWSALEAQLFNSEADQEGQLGTQLSRRISEKIANVMSIAAAAVLVLALIPLFSDPRLLDTNRVKGVSDFPLVNISAFVVKDGGELWPVNGAEIAGSTLVFKVDIPQPSAVALAMSKADQQPQVRYRTEMLSPGIGQLLKDGGRVYGYELEKGDQRLKICAITAENVESLNRRLRLITRFWDDLPSASCVLINTQ